MLLQVLEMYRLKLLILSFILAPGLFLQAQLFTTNSLQASGTIIDESTTKPVSYAQIFNESKRIGGIANEQGFFKLRADLGDTIVLSVLGYLGKVIIINQGMLQEGEHIYLTPRIYTIEAVDVVAFRSYEDFKQKFLALEAHNTETKLLRDNLARLSYPVAVEAAAEQKARNAQSQQPGVPPITGPRIISQEELQRINYARVLKEEHKQRIIDKKYNRDILYKITQLPENELTDFMGFCNFSKEYLLHATEYEILVKIEQKFEEYKALKAKGKVILYDSVTVILLT